MAVAELLVDGFASLKPLVEAVPESDSGFAQLPAQTHVAVLKTAEEVDQADVQILDERAGFFDLFERVLKGGDTGVAAGAHGLELALVDTHASGGADPLG